MPTGPRTLSIACALTAAFLAMAAPRPAAAQDGATSTAKREADRHFKNGVRLFDETKYSEALAEFEQAYALESHPLVLYNLATTHRALSQYAQAVDFYNRFLAEAKGAVKPQQLKRGEAELADVLRLIARVDVSTAPQGAMVSVDGRDVGPSPLSQALILGPGDHVVRAALDGYQPLERSVRVAAGDTLSLALALEKVPEEPVAVEATRSEAPLTVASAADRNLAVSAAYGTNAVEVSSTGAPVVGLAYELADRVALGVEGVLVAFSVVPEVRLRLVGGGALSVHAIGAVPISFTDGEETKTFAAVAGGLGLRVQAHERISLRAEGWVSYAGAERGTTVPVFAGTEVWF